MVYHFFNWIFSAFVPVCACKHEGRRKADEEHQGGEGRDEGDDKELWSWVYLADENKVRVTEEQQQNANVNVVCTAERTAQQGVHNCWNVQCEEYIYN